MGTANQLDSAIVEPPDFADAHQRHWEDANLLYDHAKWANAAYLLGFSAECGLKAAMQALDWMPVDAKGKPEKSEHRRHIQDIWSIFEDLARDQLSARFALARANPFYDWSHHNRYANRCHVDPATVRRYRKGTQAVTRIMNLVRMDHRP